MDDVETPEFNLNSSRKTTYDIWISIFLLNTGENLDEVQQSAVVSLRLLWVANPWHVLEFVLFCHELKCTFSTVEHV